MSIRDKLYQEFVDSIKKAQEYYHAREKLMPEIQEVIPGKNIKGWCPTIEDIKEFDRLDCLYQEAEKKRRELMHKLSQLDQSD
ncbi:hypothetical protein ACFLYS_01690 [Chloroflexota bacterium]